MKAKLDVARRASCLTLALLLLSPLNPQLSTLFAQGTAFIYQGRLTDNGAPFTGVVELDATLWDAATDGNEIRFSPLPRPPVMVEVSNGLFTVEVDFRKGAFPGQPRWLQFGLRKDPDPAPFTTLLPRQHILAVPYAMTAGSLTGTVPSDGLIGAYDKALTFNNTNNVFVGQGDDLTDLNASALTSGTVPTEALGNAWKIGGNTGTTPGTHFLGTTDNQPLELRVNGLQALRLQPGGSGLSSVIGGAANNQVAPGVTAASIGGGYNNTIQGGADVGTIGGGYLNTLQASASYATIGGGNVNTIQLNALSATVGGGSGNTIQTNTDYATIGGGWVNTIGLNSDYATLGGGSANTVQPDAAFATIPGGRNNSATNYAFAAGRRAKANHTGAFVWADSQDADFLSSATNEFAVRANGGVRFVTGGAGIRLDGQPVLSGPVATAQLADGAVLGELLDDDGAGSGLDADLLDGLSSAAFWQLGGNAGTTPGTHLLGTTDNQPFEIRVNNQRALRLEPAGDSADLDTIPDGAPNMIAGAPNNFVMVGVVGATIGGGGALNSSGSPRPNSVASDYGIVGGGYWNTIQANAARSFIGGGERNTIQTNASNSSIDGGESNTISSRHSTIGGGYGNGIQALSFFATLGGGYQNGIGNALYGTIGGGEENTIQGARHGTISGGTQNRIEYFSESSTVSGGWSNRIDGSYSAISGGWLNSIQSSSSVIAGGQANKIDGGISAIGGGINNNITATAGTIAGGQDNDIGTNSHRGFIGGGQFNAIAANSEYALIAAGGWNRVGTNTEFGTIGGGRENTIADNSTYSTIAGGSFNGIGTNSPFSAVVGGYGNGIANNASQSAIAGGRSNKVGTASHSSAIGGGFNNGIAANSPYATIPGGDNNQATNRAFAAGTRAKANHTGAFVWADSFNADFASTSSNQFLIRAQGGVGIGTSAPGNPLTVEGSGTTNGGVTGFPEVMARFKRTGASHTAISIDAETGRDAVLYLAENGQAKWGLRHDADQEHELDIRYSFTSASSIQALRLTTNGTLITAGPVNPPSDRHVKTGFESVNARQVLEKLASLPMAKWAYTNSPSIRHIGPVAQDFHAAFGVGSDDKHIATVDADGVALAAIQGLNQKVEQELRVKDMEIGELKQTVSELKEILRSLTVRDRERQ